MQTSFDRLAEMPAEVVAWLRIPLFRLAWDASISAFAGRQVLYEQFFFGDPDRMAGASEFRAAPKKVGRNTWTRMLILTILLKVRKMDLPP
jgi:aromatic ring hydroxylase